MKRLMTLGLLAGFIAAIGFALHTLLYTPAGLQWTLRQLQAYIPGQLTVARADGRLAGPLTLTGLHYENESLSVRAEGIALRWRPGRLVDGVFFIDELTVSVLDVTTKPSPARTGGEFDFSLPLDVVLRRLHAGPIAVHLPEQDTVTIDALDARASAREGAVTVSELRLRSPVLELDADGELPLNMRDDVQLGLRWQAAAQGRTLAGNGTVGGTWHNLTTEMRITQPLGMAVSARIMTGQDDPLRWSVRATADPFALSALLPQAPPGRVTDAELEAGGTTESLTAAGGLTWHDERYGRWILGLEAGWDGTRWDFPRIDLKAADGTMRISGRAQAQRGDDNHYRYLVEARWQDLAWPPDKTGPPLSPQGTLNLSGTAAQYTFKAEGTLQPPEVPPLRLRLSGRGTQTGIAVDELGGEWLEGAWSGRGTLAWSPALSWDLALAAQHVNPAALKAGFDGSLNAGAHIRGEYAGDALSLGIDVDKIAGTLRGYPLSARTQIAYRPGEIRLDDLQLSSGAATLALNASFGAEWRLDWRLNAPALGELYPGLAGSLQTQGHLGGQPGALRTHVELDASQASYGDIYAGAVQLRADVDTAPGGQWQVAARVEDAGSPSLHRGRLTLDVTGGSQDHTVRLAAEQDKYRIVQLMRGSLQDRRWQARLHDGELELAALGRFLQQGTTELTAAPDTLALDAWCWQQDATVLCLNASGNPSAAALQANLRGQKLDVARLTALLPDAGIMLDGTGAGEAQLTLAEGALRAVYLNMVLDEGAVSYTLPAATAQRQTLRYRQARMEIAGAGDTGLHADIRVDADDGARLAASLQLPQWDLAWETLSPQQALTASVELSLNDLSMIALFLPNVLPGEGHLQTRFALSGTLEEPRVDGQLEVKLSSLAITRLGISLRDLNLQSQVTQNRWQLQGTLRSGEGQLTLDGNGHVEARQRWEGDIALTGDGVEIVRLPTAAVSASPDIKLHLIPGEIAFSGKLGIPRAQLEPVIKQAGTGVSEDVVIVGTEEHAKTPRTRVHGTLDLMLGEEVRLSAMGLKGRLTGRLRILMNALDDIDGEGEIRLVEGRFQAYGQDLTIEKGLILYAGSPIENPALDIVASRLREKDIENIKVGVRVTGTAEQPVVQLFSDPSMDESDILSYLVLGRPLNEASESEGESLYKEAATSISLAGSGAIARSIGGVFELSEVNIESGDTAEDTALVLGKSLTPRLYVRYVQGLVDNTNMFQVRYRLSNKWTLQTESGTRSASGADLIYSFER